MTKEHPLFYGCECGHCVVEVSGYGDRHEADVFLTFYFYSGMRFWERIKEIWRILRGGKVQTDIILSADNAKTLGRDLVKLADEVQMIAEADAVRTTVASYIQAQSEQSVTFAAPRGLTR